MKKRMVVMGITMMLAGVTVLGSPKGVQAETAAEETAAVFVNESDDPQYASPLQDTNAGNLFFEIPSTSRENKRLVAKDGDGHITRKEISFSKSWLLTVEYNADDSLDNYYLEADEDEEDLGDWDTGEASFHMVKGDGIISGMAQYGNDTYRLSFVYDEEEDEQILNDFFGTMHFGDAEFNADNDLSMGNMQYVLPERDYVSMYSDLRVWSDGEISYIGIQYELGYPNFASMYFFPGSTIESRVYDEYEETEVNGIPAAYVYNDGLATHNYYFERPEGIYFIKFQLPSPDDTMEQYMNDLMASISFAD